MEISLPLNQTFKNTTQEKENYRMLQKVILGQDFKNAHSEAFSNSVQFSGKFVTHFSQSRDRILIIYVKPLQAVLQWIRSA